MTSSGGREVGFSHGVFACAQEGLRPEPPPLSEAEAGLRNEKIAVDDFGDKVASASRKARSATPCAGLLAAWMEWL
jgi:hypothetical protein